MRNMWLDMGLQWHIIGDITSFLLTQLGHQSLHLKFPWQYIGNFLTLLNLQPSSISSDITKWLHSTRRGAQLLVVNVKRWISFFFLSNIWLYRCSLTSLYYCSIGNIGNNWLVFLQECWWWRRRKRRRRGGGWRGGACKSRHSMWI